MARRKISSPWSDEERRKLAELLFVARGAPLRAFSVVGVGREIGEALVIVADATQDLLGMNDGELDVLGGAVSSAVGRLMFGYLTQVGADTRALSDMCKVVKGAILRRKTLAAGGR